MRVTKKKRKKNRKNINQIYILQVWQDQSVFVAI